MKLSKEMVACISTGIKKEIVGVGYLFTGANNLSVITGYNTKVGLFSFDKTTTTVDIRPYDRDAFPFLIGKGGERLVGLKHRSGATVIHIIEMSLVAYFSNVQSTSYKTSIKDGNSIHKKKVKVCHFDNAAFSSEQLLDQKTAFVLAVGDATGVSAAQTHALIGQTLTVWKERQLSAAQRCADMLQFQQDEPNHQQSRRRSSEQEAIHQRARILSGRARFRWWSSSNSDSEGYQRMCDDLMDLKFVQHNKGKKYSKNLKVCIQNNNNNTSKIDRSDSSAHKISKRDMTKQSKERSAQRIRHDVTRLRKKSRNWRCASIGRHSLIGDDCF